MNILKTIFKIIIAIVIILALTSLAYRFFDGGKYVMGNLGEEILLTEGEGAKVDGVRIIPTGILSDSRCKPDVQCIWAGELVVELWVKDNMSEGTTTVSSIAEQGTTFNNHRIKIVGEKSVTETNPKQLVLVVTKK